MFRPKCDQEVVPQIARMNWYPLSAWSTKIKIRKRIEILIIILALLSLQVSCSSDESAQVEKFDVTITLNYEEVFLTSNTTMNVYIDDTKIGRQEAGSTVSYDISLEKGSHTFYLKNDGIYKTDKLSFEVSKDGQIFAFGAKTRMTFGMEIWNE